MTNADAPATADDVPTSMTFVGKGGVTHVDYGNTFRIEVNGRTMLFDWHRYCGPTVVTKSGNVAKRQPGENHPFWYAIQCWCEKGKRIDGDRCVWSPPGLETEAATKPTGDEKPTP